ncbi:MAG: prepilin-type N-terminal cleavage/methylation domain-containing protein [Candidatus Sumerlaeia bacterium]|nr:prepilin-type N-terminal cleavage/methylation domain-containing protein [Candidatus Sumerlaeia bacterium]
MNKQTTTSRKPSGFTLIELLIVVAIIAILAAIAVPNFLEAQTRSKISRARADMRTVATALEAYHVDNNKYPTTPPNISCPTTQPLVDDCDGFTPSLFRQFGTLTVPDLITTPIAYITSQIPDVFKVGKSVDAGPQLGKPWSAGNDRDRAFLYLNLVQADLSFGFFESQQGLEDGRNSFGGWQMRSLGPSSSYSGGSTFSYISINAVYDPTNGTVSLGHIIRNQKDAEGTNQTDTQTD